jgi:hypothetical protein
LDIRAPDLPQRRTFCGGHIQDLVMNRATACPSLRRFTIFARIRAAANKIEFNHLNGNLVVPEIHYLNVSLAWSVSRFKFQQAERRRPQRFLKYVSEIAGFDHNVVRAIASGIGRKTCW